MSQNNSIKNSWGLIQFARSHGKMQVGKFKNAKGEEFVSCIFTDSNGARTFVGFSSNLGVLTPGQIANQKDDLQVVKLESGYHCLCKKGSSNWEDVDLGL